ncbi:MAG: FMN-binding protein [Peptostreptococcaceae bacterium]|nr:FMN-binding protein [Peptostreptococcaceae bacterium]
MNRSKDKYAFIKEYVMPTIVLVLICFVVTFSLVTTYKVTAPIIKATAEKSAESARDRVLSGSGGFKLIASIEQASAGPNEDNQTGDKQENIKIGSNIIDIYKSNNGVGYVITSADQGYGGEIKVITGFSKNGLIQNVMLLEQKETPGLGTKASKKDFTDKFIGLDNVESVDTISGATISSSAVKRAVAAALDQMRSIKEGGL